MRTFTVRSLAALCIILNLYRPCANGLASDESEILRLERIIIDAWLKHDPASIRPIVADDFQYWSYNGVRKNKSDLLRLVETGGGTDTLMQQPVVRIYGDTAIFTARIVNDDVGVDGKIVTTNSCVTDVFVRRDGKWLLVTGHETVITN